MNARDVESGRPLEEGISFATASLQDLDHIVSLVAAYHAFERITQPDDLRRQAVRHLLENPSLGEIKLILSDGALAGYIAICFGYSIEFAGRDAFIDEFFVTEELRGQGIGGRIIQQVWDDLARHGVVALHLEVDNENLGAQRFYGRHGFEARSKYHLMTRRRS